VASISIASFAKKINRDSSNFKVGSLQLLRKELKSLRRSAGNAIFTNATIFDDWAFHHGGRTELQFNIGLEPGKRLRYGVAFSLETSRSLPSIDILIPKVRLFNEFVAVNAKSLSGFRMWHYRDGTRSPEHQPRSITEDLLEEGVFIFLGSIGRSTEVTSKKILSDFDRLLPIYKFVESCGILVPSDDSLAGFKFRSGFRKKKSKTTASRTEAQLSVDLREAKLQKLLFDELCNEFGRANVGAETSNGIGGFIDVVRKTDTGYVYYEIKSGKLLQGCIRAALGQLLSYSYWSAAQRAEELVIVGEARLDDEGQFYSQTLRETFSLPVSYRHVRCPE
jgi:hypothetical protein